jgi:hypothetical protein
MRRIFCILVIVMMTTSSALAGERTSVHDAASEFLTALKSGDLAGLNGSSTDSFHEKKRRVFLKRGSYSRFLRQLYRKADISILKIAPVKDGVYSVDVAVSFDNNNRSYSTLLVERVPDGKWKVSEELPY